MCQIHTGAYVSLLARLEKPTIPLATQERLPRTYCTQYLSLPIRTTDASQLEKKERKGDKGKERNDKEAKNERGKEKRENIRKAGQDKERKQGKEKRKKKGHNTSRPKGTVTKHGIGLKEGVKCNINGT